MIRGKKDQEITTAIASTEMIVTVVKTEIDTSEEERPLSMKMTEEKEGLIEIGDIGEVTIILDLILKIRASRALRTIMVKTEIVEAETIKERKEALIMVEVNNLHKTRMASHRITTEQILIDQR